MLVRGLGSPEDGFVGGVGLVVDGGRGVTLGSGDGGFLRGVVGGVGGGDLASGRHGDVFVAGAKGEWLAGA